MKSTLAPSTVSASSGSLHYDDTESSLSDTSLGTASSVTLHPAQDSYPKNVLDDKSFSPILLDCIGSLDAHAKIMNDFPNSSTPDLRSRSSSTSSLSAADSQALKTPPQDAFVLSLNRKLEALIREGRLNDDRLKPRYTDYSSKLDVEEAFERRSYECSYSQESVNRSGTGASPNAETHHILKRKRNGSNSSHDAELESGASSSGGNCKKIIRSSILNSKKMKRTSFSYAASKTASARLAQGLSASASFASASGLVSTEPVSPPDWSTASNSCEHNPTVVSLPNFSSIPRPPLTADDAAEQRLRIMLQKEEERRLLDGFERGINLVFDKKITQDEVDSFLGIDESFRRKVIQWMLSVRPFVLFLWAHIHALQVTPSKKLRVGQLRDQLRTSPETRFHAILLFSRYFMRVGGAMPIPSAKETPLMRLGRQRITWDVAVSCLALAVKV